LVPRLPLLALITAADALVTADSAFVTAAAAVVLASVANTESAQVAQHPLAYVAPRLQGRKLK
jgi:hypothetical protein